MQRDAEDRYLYQQFQQMKKEHVSMVPAFDALIDTIHRQEIPKRNQYLHNRWIAAAVFFCCMCGVGVSIWVSQHSQDTLRASAVVANWTSPTQFLLRTSNVESEITPGQLFEDRLAYPVSAWSSPTAALNQEFLNDN